MTTHNAPAYAQPCPAMIARTPHAVEWLSVPAAMHDADGAISHAPAYERGFCWDCDEQFTRGI